ncbi:MAG: hypothetical protein OEZ48_14460 [Candidatus Bathyarchaeota archaeon]|nr:hypothetical protein [Candidatus Bathyarchaeota archaeon]
MRLRLMVVVPFCLLLLLLLLPPFGSAGVSPQETTWEITVPWASSAEADGFIEVGEYDDALEIDLSNATWEAYLYVKHDGDFLYVFIDHVSDTIHHPAGYDNGWVAIDSLSDGGDAPKEDDYLFHSSGHHIYLGDGPHQITNGQWEELMGHGETPPDLKDKLEPFLGGRYSGSGPGAFGVSQNSLTPHSIFEIKFPIMGWKIEGKTSFGFCAAAGSPGTHGDHLAKVVWPDTAYDNYTADFYAGGVRTLDPLVGDPQIGSFPPPSTWGILTLGKESITAPLAKVVPTPDGFISSGEWDDAEVVAVGCPDSYGYLYVKHNYTFLWVFLDHITDTVKSPLGWDNGWVAIDPDRSGGSEPQEYDLLFHSHGHLVFIGDGVDPIEGSQWGILRGHVPEDTPPEYWDLRDFIIEYYAGSGPGWGLTNASGTFHAFFELQIPLGVLELIPGLNNTKEFGFCASMQDNDAKTIIDWPVTQSTGNFWPGPDSPEGSYTPPDSWGILTLGNESLAEKPPLPPPPSFYGPWTDPNYPTGTGWLLYPNGGEKVFGIVTIRWNTSKTPELGPDDEIYVGWSHAPRGNSSTFEHEDWEADYCQRYHVITDSAPNTGEYQWNATQALEECNGEHYPYYIKLMGGPYMDASNRFFNITGRVPIYIFEAPWDDKTFHVIVYSNSIVSDFSFSQPTKEIGFNVTGTDGTTGFCNVTIPIELLDGAFMVLIDNFNTFYMLTWNETHTFLYFVYSHSTHTVQIIGTNVVPEFPTLMVLPLFMIAILVVVMLAKSIRSRACRYAHA